jgi:hypothetical protein
MRTRDLHPMPAAETRSTPWAEQTYHEALSIWEPYGSDVGIHGTWLQDTEDPRQSEDSNGQPIVSYGKDVSKISSPSRALLQSFRAPGNVDAVYKRNQSSPTQQEVQASKGRCMLLELPPELMEQILDHIVPYGCVYQFITSRDQKGLVQIVQRSTPKHCKPGSSAAHLALAATCEEMNAIVYSTLYGQNKFIFNISAAPIRAHTRSADFRTFEGWSRILRQTPTP